ncbi:retrovirus-related pol polyprotein from transposon TNT 1-94 [Tanacetum coccineum]
MIIKKDSEIVKAKVERKSLALNAKKESSDEECSNSESEDKEYAMAIRDFKKVFKRRGRFPPKDKNQRAFVGGSWSDSSEEDDEMVKNETCLVAQALSEPSGEKLGLGFKASSSGTNEIKFVKVQKKAYSDGGPINMGDPRNVQAASKANMGPPPATTSGSEKNICLGVDLEPDEWIKDNGCSKHMIGNQKFFSSYKAYNKGNVIFGSNLCGNIIGKGQICDNKCRVTFSEHDSEITKDGKVICRGYSQNSKAYIILNKHTRKVEESLNVTFDETPPPSKTSPLVDDDLDEEEAVKVTEKKNLKNDIVDETLEINEIVNIKESRNHPLENVIGNLNQRTLKSQAQNQSNFFCLISTIEPKNVNEALTDDSWIVAMQEELNQFIANDVWELVPQPKNMTIIGTKWVFRNKLDENDIVSQNKARSYKTTPPSPKFVKSFIQIPRQGQLTRTKNKKTVIVNKNEILTRKIQPHMKPWVDIIRENAICLGGHKDHVFACLCHMLYCIETSTRYNLAFFILKRMEKTRNKPKELLPYGMLLTRLFKHVVSVFPELEIDHYISHDRVMHPLAPHYERKTRSDHGKKRPRESNASSSSTTLNHPSSSHPLDDTIDENDDESFHSNSSSPSQNISSSSNVVSRVRQNPPHESHNLNTYLSETINLQTQQRDAHREGLRSIGQALKNMMGGKRK